MRCHCGYEENTYHVSLTVSVDFLLWGATQMFMHRPCEALYFPFLWSQRGCNVLFKLPKGSKQTCTRTDSDCGLQYRISFCESDLIKLGVWLLTEQVHFLFPGTLGQVFHGPLAWSNLLEENILRLNLSLWLPRLEPWDGSLSAPPFPIPPTPYSLYQFQIEL